MESHCIIQFMTRKSALRLQSPAVVTHRLDPHADVAALAYLDNSGDAHRAVVRVAVVALYNVHAVASVPVAIDSDHQARVGAAEGINTDLCRTQVVAVYGRSKASRFLIKVISRIV